jgi:signal transduction histidine kinase
LNKSRKPGRTIGYTEQRRLERGRGRGSSGRRRYIYQHLQQQINASAEVQSSYLSFLSHDLRNHLNHATLRLQLLAAKLAQVPEFADRVEDIQSIKRAIFQTTAGMDRLLQAEQLRKESVELRTDPVNLNLLISEVMKQVDHEAKSKGLELDADVPEGAQAASDEGLLTLILQNLLGNAVKHSSRGRIKVIARNTAYDEDTSWVLSIVDQGPGIAPENLPHLFDAFRRGDTYGKPGVGLRTDHRAASRQTFEGQAGN